LFFWFALGVLATWAQSPPPGCAGFPNCLYSPQAQTTFTGAATSTTYRDLAGDNRIVGLYLRIPEGISAALPVVIWSHPDTTTGDPSTRMALWSEATARAGYLTITVAHPLREVSRAAEICTRLRLEDEACFAIGLANWDWPNDLREVLNWLERANTAADSPLRGRVDLRRIVVAGHDDGSNAAISLAGAKRLLVSQDRRRPNEFTDPRPVAFIALSPQGPLIDGFYDYDYFQPNHSWMQVTRPVLMAFSAGDNTCPFGGQCAQGSSSARRRVAYDLLPAGNKHLLYIKTTRCSHELIGTLDASACVAAGIESELCTSMAAWLRASVLAFLDAQLRNRESARTWLRQGLVAETSGGQAEGLSK
jgi:hypothetical protein